MTAPGGGDPYVYPGTAVLRNYPGIRDPDELQARETRVVAFRSAKLAVEPLPGSYDLQHLQAFHRSLFGDLYPWAGQLRTVAIAKTQMFCLPQHTRGLRRGRLGAARPRRVSGRRPGARRGAEVTGPRSRARPSYPALALAWSPWHRAR